MAVSVSILAVITSLHLIAFVLAIGAERRRSTVTLSLSLSLSLSLYLSLDFWVFIRSINFLFCVVWEG